MPGQPPGRSQASRLGEKSSRVAGRSWHWWPACVCMGPVRRWLCDAHASVLCRLCAENCRRADRKCGCAWSGDRACLRPRRQCCPCLHISSTLLCLGCPGSVLRHVQAPGSHSLGVCRVRGECRTPVVSQTSACVWDPWPPCLSSVVCVVLPLPVGGLGSPGPPSVCNPVAETDA